MSGERLYGRVVGSRVVTPHDRRDDEGDSVSRGRVETVHRSVLVHVVDVAGSQVLILQQCFVEFQVFGERKRFDVEEDTHQYLEQTLTHCRHAQNMSNSMS